MIKNIIEKLKKIYMDSTTEEIYVKEVMYIQKECWKSHMNQENIFKETTKYLNKLKLSQDRHPFLITFRSDMNKLLEGNIFDSKEADRLFNSLYNYREELLKKKLD